MNRRALLLLSSCVTCSESNASSHPLEDSGRAHSAADAHLLLLAGPHPRSRSSTHFVRSPPPQALWLFLKRQHVRHRLEALENARCAHTAADAHLLLLAGAHPPSPGRAHLGP